MGRAVSARVPPSAASRRGTEHVEEGPQREQEEATEAEPEAELVHEATNDRAEGQLAQHLQGSQDAVVRGLRGQMVPGAVLACSAGAEARPRGVRCIPRPHSRG